MKKLFAAAALAASFALPMAANAVTTDMYVGGNYSVVDTFPSADPTTGFKTIVFTFEAKEDLKVIASSFGATASQGGIGSITLAIVRGTLAPASAAPFEYVAPTDNVGSTSLAPFNMYAGDFFTATYTGQPFVTANANASVSTAAVPLPAAGGMLLFAVVAGGIAGRRKNKKA